MSNSGLFFEGFYEKSVIEKRPLTLLSLYRQSKGTTPKKPNLGRTAGFSLKREKIGSLFLKVFFNPLNHIIMPLIIGIGQKALDVQGGNSNNGTPVILWTAHGNSNQQWELTPDGFIISKLAPGKCLDAKGGSTENGTPIILWDKHGGLNQKWQYLPDGTIVSAMNPNKCLDAKGASVENGTPIILWDKHGGSNQRWGISHSTPTVQTPLKGYRKDKVSKGGMETNFTIFTTGLLTAETRTWSNSKLIGFTGSIQIILLNAKKGLAWISSKNSYGVNGKIINTGPDDRKDTWQSNVPMDIINGADEYAIVHSHDPKFDFFELLDDIVKGTKKIGEVYMELKGIISKLK